MFAYDKKDSSIEIYSIESDNNILEEYRNEKMKLIPEEYRVYKAKQVCKELNEEPFFEKHLDEVDSRFFSSAIVDRKTPFAEDYHILLPEFDTDLKKQLIDRYIKGEYVDRKTATILYDTFKYFLLTEPKYKRCTNNNYTHHMNNIIQIPDCLYALQLLQQEKYNQFLEQETDINEILSLFEIERIDEISEEEIIKCDRYGITDNAYNKVLSKVNNSKQLINYIK